MAVDSRITEMSRSCAITIYAGPVTHSSPPRGQLSPPGSWRLEPTHAMVPFCDTMRSHSLGLLDT